MPVICEKKKELTSIGFKAEEWSRVHYYVNKEDDLASIVGEVIPQVAALEKKGEIKNYFFFRYILPDNIHLKVVMQRADTLTHDKLMEELNKFKITTALKNNPDFNHEQETEILTENGKALPDFILASTGRKMADLLKSEIKDIGYQQLFFVLHYFYNDIGFSNDDEIKTAIKTLLNYPTVLHVLLNYPSERVLQKLQDVLRDVSQNKK